MVWWVCKAGLRTMLFKTAPYFSIQLFYCSQIGLFSYSECNVFRSLRRLRPGPRLHSQKRHRLVESCQFYQLVTTCQQVATNSAISPSCNKAFKIRLVADLLQFVETTCSKPVDNNFWQSTSKKSVDNLQQNFRQQAYRQVKVYTLFLPHKFYTYWDS